MNGVQGTSTVGNQWNKLLDAVFSVMKYKGTTIGNVIKNYGISVC